jgi:hypothetical protein
MTYPQFLVRYYSECLYFEDLLNRQDLLGLVKDSTRWIFLNFQIMYQNKYFPNKNEENYINFMIQTFRGICKEIWQNVM